MLLDAFLTTEDVVLAVGAAVIVAGLVFSFAVLTRYRSLTAQTMKSNELAKDLWVALDSRMNKQDERIVDLMARIEVYGVKAEKGAVRVAPLQQLRESGAARVSPLTETPGELVAVQSSRTDTKRSDQVEKKILQILSEGDRNSRDIKEMIGKSREHTARLMKSLFDDGYVIRNEQEKPFTYQITDVGRRYLVDNLSVGK